MSTFTPLTAKIVHIFLRHNAFVHVPQEPFNTVRFLIVGDGSASRYFEIDEQSGRLTLKSSVAEDAALQYTVST